MFPTREINTLVFIKENSQAGNIKNIDVTEIEAKFAENLNLLFLWHVLSASVSLLPKYTVIWEMEQNKILEPYTRTKERSLFSSMSAGYWMVANRKYGCVIATEKKKKKKYDQQKQISMKDNTYLKRNQASFHTLKLRSDIKAGVQI